MNRGSGDAATAFPVNGHPLKVNNYSLENNSTNKLIMDNSEVEKSKALTIVETIEYVPHSVIRKTIIKKLTGNVVVTSFDTGEGLTEKISPFDTFAQIIDGKAEIVIDGQSHILETGQSIIIPAHTSNFIKPNKRFKMISTVIKSGYE